MDRNEVIKKHILIYLFSCSKCKYINDPRFTLYNKVSKQIEKELKIKLLNPNEFYGVFDSLINDEIIEIKLDEENTVIKGGCIELRSVIKVRDYLIENNYIGLKEAFIYTDNKYHDSLEMFVLQLKRMENAEKELKMQRQELLDKIQRQEAQIKNFYNNILTILGILVAVFSIIGFNIGGIKFILGSGEKLQPWVYAGSIGVINLSILISMYLLFWLVNRVINKPEDRKGAFSSKVVIGLFCILIIVIVICFVIA